MSAETRISLITHVYFSLLLLPAIDLHYYALTSWDVSYLFNDMGCSRPSAELSLYGLL
ncbi:uncharacterized protein EURHEDRAFT_36555 [Aspergillus ruber CBS 135680]|uniref:Uncharacterized protein n=1 Tax=Aspergillus ruber (strain CBS 135680) TaxID=1388766 RepID=A0A017SHQ2_ASPRC|nr:uncharacterized protein EURHEDRAFT_36555 [Aspergillus ruber CBS 135680]EYE95835.1 hypothetical protein EURHEDRAFT_36555 [Aspergillus ruber CBS 135680]